MCYGLRSKLNSGQKIGSIKNTNKKNNTDQITPIRIGYAIRAPFTFGFNECAINPWIPILKNRKTRLETTIKKVLE